MNTWIETYTGRRFDSYNPKVEDVDIIDIAHALSLQCRFNGHCKMFYSVAQHSVYVSELCNQDPMWGLLHDAAEAYIGDVIKPLKWKLDEFISLEADVMLTICKKFGLNIIPLNEVKIADQTLLRLEADVLTATGGKGLSWEPTETIDIDLKVIPWSSDFAEKRFLETYVSLSYNRIGPYNNAELEALQGEANAARV